MITRRKDGIVTQKLYPTLLLTELKPTHHKTALKDPKWVEAMNAEYVALLENNTWNTSALSSHCQ
jgi:hypothetical protein